MTADKTHPDLYKKTLKGTLWLFLLRLFQQILGYAKWIILARLLHPRDFGLFGFVMLTLELLNTFTQTGLQSALIRHKGDIYNYLNSVWTVGIVRAFLVSVLLWISAPSVAYFIEGSWEWNSRDILKPHLFLEKIQKQDTPVSAYIRAHISLPALSEGNNLEERSQTEIASVLASDLNTLCREQGLKDPQIYSEIRLSAYSRHLLTETLEGSNLYRANRLLLEDAYPECLQRKIINKSEFIRIIQIVAVLIFLSSFGNICTLYFQKELDFHKQFLLTSISSFLSIGITIGLAVFYRNVWPLVGGYAAALFISLVLGYYLYPYKPRFEMELKKVRSLWSFGKWITFSGILSYFLTQGDDLFVGKMLGVGALGFYLMAYKISNLPTTEITDILMKVSFPAYSKIQDDLPRLRTAYLKMVSLVTLPTFLFSCLICLFAKDFVDLFMGQKWTPVIPCIQVLALWGCVRPLGTTSGVVFMSCGRPAYITGLQIFKLLFLALFIYPLTIHYGITGTALAVLGSSVIVQVPTIWYLAKVLECKIRQLLRPIWAPLVGAGSMLIVVFAVRTFVFSQSSGAVLICLVLMALLIYFISSWLMDWFGEKRLILLWREQIMLFWNVGSKDV